MVSPAFATSMGPIGGFFDAQSGSNYLKVTSLTGGAPGETAGLQVGDYIYGAFGENLGTLTGDMNDGWVGSVQDFGNAIERAESGNGLLPITVLRPGIGKVDINVQLSAVGGFGPSYPLGSQKFDNMYQWSCEQIHAQVSADNSGSTGHNSGLYGLILLSHPEWNSLVGLRPYRVSINKLRDNAVNYLAGRVFAPAERMNLDGTPNDGSVDDSDPNDQNHVGTGLENWTICTAAMFIAEYRNKTGDASVDVSVQRASDMLTNRVQDYQQPPLNGSPGPTRIGMMGHGGVDGDYSHIGWTGLNIINAQTVSALAMLKDAGANVNDDKFQKCFAYMRGATNDWGGADDGNVGYTYYKQGGYDSSGRTAGTIYGVSHYGNVSASDQLVIDRQKAYMVRQWQRMQHAHAYTVGGVYLYQFAMPYLSDRQQRYIMENLRFYYQFHRNANGTLEYFGGRGNNGGDGYLNYNNVKMMNVAIAQAVQSGNLPSFPAVNSGRVHADFKAPYLTWSDIESRKTVVRELTSDFNVDITDYVGTVLNDIQYTAAWTHVSGPGTATFSSASSASTTVTFPSAGSYRIQLEVIKDGYTLTEPIDIEVLPVPTPAGYTAGNADYRVYQNITGTAVTDLTNNAKYPDAPDISGSVDKLEGSHGGDNYGSRIRGYIIPQVSGNYTFYIASDDTSEFRLSTDDDEANALTICSESTYSAYHGWTDSPEQTSLAKVLTAGQPYFFEVNHKEGTGGDHVAVAWTGPGFSTPTVISGNYLAQADSGAVAFVTQPVDQSSAPGTDASFNVGVSGQGPFLYQWTLDGVAYWPASASSALNLTNVGAGHAGAYRCVVTSPSGTVTSSHAVLTVTGVGQTVAGGLWREVYEGIGGGSVNDLTSNSKYPKFPDSGGVIATSEAPSEDSGNYGQRWTGWVVPDTTGPHTFFLASDDSSEIWLSTDDNEYNKVRITQVNGYVGVKSWSSGGQSAAIELTAGTRYYIEVRHKQGGGGEHCAVNWQTPGGPAPVNGSGSIPSGNLEYRQGGIHVTAVNIALALASPTKGNIRIRPGVGLDLAVTATPAPVAGDSIDWTQESGPGVVTFENPASFATGATFSLEGTYVLRCTVNNGGPPSITEVTVTVSSAPVEAWISDSIAEPTAGNGVVNSSSQITVMGSGTDIGKLSDQGQLFHQTLTGNFDVRARVSSKSLSATLGTHAMLMARETSDANSRMVAMTHDQANHVGFLYREIAGLNATEQQAPDAVLPAWIRLVRSGSNPVTGAAGQTFTGYYSVDNGATWTQQHTVDYVVPMPEIMKVGFAVSSGGASLNTVVFDNVSGFIPTPNYGPEVDAGSNDTSDLAVPLNLSSTVSDDGMPAGATSTTWQQVSGPGTTSFGDNTATDTTATFSTPGSYVLRQYADDSEVITYDDVTMTITSNVDVNLSASDASASEQGPDTGEFTITRTGDTTDPLTVILSYAGSATNGTDYSSLPNSVIIPAASASTTLTLTPLADGSNESTETAELVLQPGAYNIGTSPAIVNIADDPDNDGDGLPDSWEEEHFVDTTVTDGSGDADNDGFTDAQEFAAGTDPNNPDDDGDGYPDGLEAELGTDPLDGNSKPTPATNLVHHWKFDEASGTAVADSVITSPVAGVSSNATLNHCQGTGNISVNGSTGKVDVPSTAAFTGTGDFAVSLWVRNTSSNGGRYVQQRDASTNGFNGQFRLSQNNTGNITFSIHNGGYQFQLTSSAVVNDGTWHHIMAVRDGGNGAIYVDGTLSASATGTPIKSMNGLQISIGYDRRDNNNYHQGQLDDVRFYTRPLVAADATAMMSNQVPAPVTATFSVAEDAASGTVVDTLSANDTNSGDLHCFSITAGNGAGLFAIADNGEITTTGALDYETTQQYVLTVEVQDNGTPSLAISTTVTIDVTDVVASDDSDSNSLNDNWEVTHYGSVGSVTANSDTDNDGYTAFQEMVFGSNPKVNEANNAPMKIAIVDDGGTDKIEFKFRRPLSHADYDVTYQLQICDDLQVSSWAVNTTPFTTTTEGSNEWVTYLLPAPSEAERRNFYRCKVTSNSGP